MALFQASFKQGFTPLPEDSFQSPRAFQASHSGSLLSEDLWWDSFEIREPAPGFQPFPPGSFKDFNPIHRLDPGDPAAFTIFVSTSGTFQDSIKKRKGETLRPQKTKPTKRCHGIPTDPFGSRWIGIPIWDLFPYHGSPTTQNTAKHPNQKRQRRAGAEPTQETATTAATAATTATTATTLPELTHRWEGWKREKVWHTDCILVTTSRPVLRACVKVLVATKERFTSMESFLGTSPNGFSSFMWVLTHIKYL